MSQKMQLAIQGGGAKIALLIAAMEAVEELQESGVLEVTRIAGTSAGSIVGCLFAAGISMKTVRNRLRDGLGERLLRAYRAPSVGKVIRQATPFIGGSPFWDETHLRTFLAEFFENPDIKLNELNKPMIVMSANITDLRAFSHKDDDYVISAITNSCGLPFCFRTWSRGGGPVLVDGGICENLPTEVLEKNADQYGPIAAISFEQQVSYAPRDVIGFTKALLDTAINNSITRAKGALPPNSVYPIKTSLSTFDFHKALTTGLNEEYKAVRLEASNWFRKFAERNQNLGL
ncbi:MAG TPA: patatin-like phospholipase family protein, partial [Pyrinomonadaceae bacterium]|nr:patatin-like phospholipase family protein [Pyrinomonadaceae bacterium]